MIRLLLDVNIIVDVLFARTPHLDASLRLWRLIEEGKAEGWLAAHGVTTLHYLIRQQTTSSDAMRAVANFIPLFQIAPIDRAIILDAISLNWPDFEDAVTAIAAARAQCAAIVTRDAKGIS